jgi:hypothetical protein
MLREQMINFLQATVPAARPTTVDAVTRGAALELVAQIKKTGLQTAVYLGVMDAADRPADGGIGGPDA